MPNTTWNLYHEAKSDFEPAIMKYKGIIFDLDGTLANTLDDIAGSMNRVLQLHGYPEHPVTDYKLLVGRGLDNLVKQSLPAEARDTDIVATCIGQMMEDYNDHCLDKTHLYQGIRELIDKLISMKIVMAVLSNKTETLTIKIVNQLLSDVPFRKIMGADAAFPKKPDPASALFISESLGIPPRKLIYMGDSDVDMITAKNAGMYAVGVSWGFRSAKELLENGADITIDRPQQVKNVIRGRNPNLKVHRVYNRKKRQLESEVSANVSGLSFLYGSLAGKILNPFIARHFISSTYGKYVKSRRSKIKIKTFVQHYQIDLSDVKRPLESFTSLNNFFIRELKSTARPVDKESSHLVSPADARLLVFNLSDQNALPIKGYWISLSDFVADKKLSKDYADGWCFVYRLAPCDYHRFCYVDDGMQDAVRRIKGVLHSVNPIALSSVNALMARNYRELTIMHTANFGRVLHFEVGALMVGRVFLHNRHVTSFFKGEEKGWFEFGGSTIIQLFSKDAIIPDKDILEQSGKGIETLIHLGEKTGGGKRA